MLTTDEIATDESAFEAGFNSQRGDLAEPEPEVKPAPAEPEPEVEPTPAEPAPAEPELEVEPAPDEPAPAEVPKALIAGLTEDQVAQALARVSAQQNTIDKLGGRIGQLMQQVEALKSKPATAGERQQFNLKLEKLGEAFPELAEILREDFKELQPGEASIQPPAAPSFTAEDVDAIVNQRLTQFQQQQELGLEVRMLGTAHPDWEQTIRTPQFALWRDNVIEDGRALMESESAAFISLKLTQFKEWDRATSAPTPVPTPAPAKQPSQRLANAITPKSQGAARPTELTGDDAFLAGFKAERAKSGW